MSTDLRSRTVAMLPFCMICQAFQAQGIVRRHPAIVKPVLEVLVDNDVNLIQMPCPESLFGGLENGLIRNRQGYRRYDTPEFRAFCAPLVEQTVHTICTLTSRGFKVVAILGIEYSPSCAVEYQYEGRTVHRPGIFTELLADALEEHGLDIPFVGVNRRGPGRAVGRLRKLLEPEQSIVL